MMLLQSRHFWIRGYRAIAVTSRSCIVQGYSSSPTWIAVPSLGK